MNTSTKFFARLQLICVLALMVGCNAAVNEDINIAAGSRLDDGATTVNGNIVVGAEAESDGKLKTINGSIKIKAGARVKDIATVNGSVLVGVGASVGDIQGINSSTECEENAQVDGSISAVNGRIQLKTGTTVSGDVSTVNGLIIMNGATVDGDVSNYNGGITLTDATLVKGDLTVQKPEGRLKDSPLVILGAGSEVRGQMIFKRPVRLYVHEQARHGQIQGAEPVSFSGTELPEDG